MADTSRSDRLRTPLLVLIALICAQVLWLVGEFGAERRALLERRAIDPGRELTSLLRHEVESAQRHLSVVRGQAEVLLKERLRERVDEAVDIATAVHAQAQGRMPPQAVRALVREALRTPRFFDGRGYYFIDGMDGDCVLLPTVPHLEGTSLLDNRDDAGRYIMRELIRAVSGPGDAGYVRYSWYSPGISDRMDDKIAYARQFKPFGWLIGSGDYVTLVEEGLKRDALERLRAIRLTHGGRLVVLDETGMVRLFPDLPTLEGTKVDNLPDGPEAAVLAAIWNAGRGGTGAARFKMADARTGRARDGFAWAQREPTFNWVVAAMATADELDPATPAASDWLWLGRYGLPAALLLTALVWVVAALPGRGRRCDEP